MMSPDHFLNSFDRIVEKYPDNVAVLTDGRDPVTYKELQEKAQKIAAVLRREGAGPETLVGLQIEKSADYLASLLGCWYADAAFMPLFSPMPV
jgi:acyl-CoA synthetase (AMP-forming)/AMP-acid ligase II